MLEISAVLITWNEERWLPRRPKRVGGNAGLANHANHPARLGFADLRQNRGD